jgi:hypothetical protein
MTVLSNIVVNVSGTFGDSSFSYDAGTGSDRILFAWVMPQFSSGAETINGVTFNGVSMTADAQISIYTDKPLRLFYLVNPASGSNTLAYDMSVGDRRVQVMCAYVSGFTAVSNLARDASPGSSTTPSVTVTSANGETVVSFCASDSNPSQTLTPSSPAVEEYDSDHTYWHVCAMSEASAGASVTIDGTLSQGGARWGMAAVSLTPAGGGGTQDLAGAATGAGAAAGAVSVTKPLAGSATGQGAATGALSAEGVLQLSFADDVFGTDKASYAFDWVRVAELDGTEVVLFTTGITTDSAGDLELTDALIETGIDYHVSVYGGADSVAGAMVVTAA